MAVHHSQLQGAGAQSYPTPAPGKPSIRSWRPEAGRVLGNHCVRRALFPLPRKTRRKRPSHFIPAGAQPIPSLHRRAVLERIPMRRENPPFSLRRAKRNSLCRSFLRQRLSAHNKMRFYSFAKAARPSRSYRPSVSADLSPSRRSRENPLLGWDCRARHAAHSRERSFLDCAVPTPAKGRSVYTAAAPRAAYSFGESATNFVPGQSRSKALRARAQKAKIGTGYATGKILYDWRWSGPDAPVKARKRRAGRRASPSGNCSCQAGCPLFPASRCAATVRRYARRTVPA